MDENTRLELEKVNIDIWDESHDEYEERLTLRFSLWLDELQTSSYQFEVL